MTITDAQGASAKQGWFTGLPVWAKVLFVLILPVSITYGVVVMWKDKMFTQPVRIALTAAAALFFVAAYVSGGTTPDALPIVADTPAEAPVPETDSVSEEHEPEAEPEPEPAAESDVADRAAEAVLTAFGVDTFQDILFAEGAEGSLLGYISRWESVGSTAIFTVQLTKTDVTKEELERAAFNIHSLVGQQVEDLDRVEVKTADSELRGISNRRDVPILNQD